MTILAGVRGKNFVVMAADQRVIDGDGHAPAGRLGPSARKLALHPSIPLAVAVMGVGCLPDDTTVRLGLAAWRGWTPADTTAVHVARLLPLLDAARELSLERVAHRLAEGLTERYRAWRRLVEPQPGLLRDLTLLIGLVGAGGPELGRLVLRGERSQLEPRSTTFGCPASVFSQVSKSLVAQRAQAACSTPGASVDDVALNVGRYMQHVIDTEASHHGGKNVEIGGPVDVAVVGHTGAQWWQRTSRAQRRRG